METQHAQAHDPLGAPDAPVQPPEAPMTTMEATMPVRPVRVVWQVPVDYEDDASCEWCGKYTGGSWVIEAAPMPERFCSPQCVADDTNTCWSPSEHMPPYDWSGVPL